VQLTGQAGKTRQTGKNTLLTGRPEKQCGKKCAADRADQENEANREKHSADRQAGKAMRQKMCS
jgi:hypothetical protein